MTHVLAVDGNSLGHRAFHAKIADAPTGPFVTATVLQMLGNVWSHGPYDAVIVAFDHPVNQRKLEFPEYKAHRPPPHPDLAGHLVDLRVHLAELGFTVAEQEGAEADDLLAAAADEAVTAGWRCDLLSSDRDLTTLVGPLVRLLRPRGSMLDLLVEDETAVRATYGIEAHQYADLAALRGDPSDGLRGANGIGPKLAARLVRDYGDVLSLYDALPDLPPKIEAALRRSRADVERNLLVMAPLPHLRVDVAACAAAGIDLDRVMQACTRLAIPWVGTRFCSMVTAPPPPPVPPPPDEDAIDVAAIELARAARAARAALAAAADVEQAALF